MSQHNHDTPSDQPQDVVESIVPLMPIVLPIAGGVPMFLLAFIAVFMAWASVLRLHGRMPAGAFGRFVWRRGSSPLTV
ncbi:hypothetical protein D9M68_970690 [compost metagenome]